MSITAFLGGAILRRGSTNRAAVEAVQRALRAEGAELVPDGDFGAITESAVRAFQSRHGLEMDGRVGPATARALDGKGESLPPATAAAVPALPSAIAVAPWLSVMRAITGTVEVRGGADSPVILGWVKEIVAAYPDMKGTVGWYNHDSIPWCGLGAGICMVRSGIRPPRLLLGAINWLNDWPDGYRLKEPCPGAVLVKSRAGGGHVTFYECEDANYYYCRGANQSDAVNVAAIRKDATVKGFMWPKTGPAPGTRLIGTIASARAGSEA